MAILYSNIPLTKETKAETILELISAEGSIFSIIDKTTEVYKNKTKLIRNFEFVKKPMNEYQVQLIPNLVSDNVVLGLYIAEGFDFDISTKSDPVFQVIKNNVDVSLKSFYSKKAGVSKITVGLYPIGTVIRYKINGVPYKDVLTKNGWSTRNKFTSVSDVAENAKAEEFLTEENKKINELIQKAEELAAAGEISKDLLDRYKKFNNVFDEKIEDRHIIVGLTAQEIESLKKKGL